MSIARRIRREEQRKQRKAAFKHFRKLGVCRADAKVYSRMGLTVEPTPQAAISEPQPQQLLLPEPTSATV